MKIFLANLLWFLSTVPDAIRFLAALRDPVRAQRRTARRRRPTREEDVLLYEPTSGTTGGTKWIPYTEQLRREFMRAVNPWMFSLYLRHPSLFLSTHYWSISPYTESRRPPDGRRAGFAEDREYLGPLRTRLVAPLFPVAAAVAEERDPERHRLLTARSLLASRRRLGLVSVWHPSAFLRLLDFMRAHSDGLADGTLRDDLAAGRFRSVWPRLAVISCWDAAFARSDAERLRAIFPGVEVEGKGLLATEGVVTFPWFGSRVAAVTSHTLGFEPVGGDGEPVAGRTLGVGELEAGGRYGVVLTTGNGFTDYRLGDIVECTGFAGRVPRLEFVRRAGGWVDLHGEKMSSAFAGEVIAALAEKYGWPRFAQFAPRGDRRGYELAWDGDRLPDAADVEDALSANYHYAHARSLEQLEAVRVIAVQDALAAWCAMRGIPIAAAKVPPLVLPGRRGG